MGRAHGAPSSGWPIAILGAVISTSVILVLMRSGLPAGVVTTSIGLRPGSVVASFDLSSRYADRALEPIARIASILAYGAAAALAGKPILGDPLRSPAGR